MSEAAVKLDPKPKTVLDAFSGFEHFAKCMLDAYAVVDHTGRVVKANQLFSSLVGLKSRQVLKADSFDDLLGLYIDETQIVVADLLKNTSPTRIDEVRGRNNQSSDLNLIIGIYPFIDEETEAMLGAFLLIRDVTAETNLQDKYKTTAMKSITDPLTGLFTRAYFEDFLELQIKAFNALGDGSDAPTLSLIMVDIDFFKKVNDVYGHQAGDHVLKVVSAVMKKTFRKTDVVCRYGGEEFLVILPSTPIEGACHAAEKLRQAVEAEHIIFDGGHIPVTISTGVGQLDHPRETYMATMARADAALYHSKEAGRNRVSFHNGKQIIGFNAGA